VAGFGMLRSEDLHKKMKEPSKKSNLRSSEDEEITAANSKFISDTIATTFIIGEDDM